MGRHRQDLRGYRRVARRRSGDQILHLRLSAAGIGVAPLPAEMSEGLTGPRKIDNMRSTSARGVKLEIDHVGKSFGGFEALRPTTIDIEPGEFVSVVGPSGCGKSTLMLMVAGLLKTSQGTIRVGGKPLSGPMTDVGIAFQ